MLKTRAVPEFRSVAFVRNINDGDESLRDLITFGPKYFTIRFVRKRPIRFTYLFNNLTGYLPRLIVNGNRNGEVRFFFLLNVGAGTRKYIL